MFSITEKLLNNRKSPSRKVGEIDNRGSHFYLALYWAKYLSEQNISTDLKEEFEKVYDQLSKNNNIIMSEINSVQGEKVNLEGYFNTNDEITKQIMRPSLTFNKIIDNI